jgi:D-tyrosyl-tRNA(Tyr) deacylase
VKAVVQRVTSASVTVDDGVVGQIARGLVVLVGIERGDGAADVQFIARKIRDLRVFEASPGSARHFDRSVSDVAAVS